MATAEAPIRDGRGDGFDDDADDLAGLDLTTAGIGEMLPGVLPPLVWELSAHLVEEALRETLAALGARLDDLPGARALVRRVRGRAAMDFGLLAAMAARFPGSSPEQMEEQYFGSGRPGRPVGPAVARRHGPLRTARHDLRVLRSRRRAVLDAALAVHATEEIAAAPPAIETLDDHALLAYRLRLADLAVRAMTAELGVAAQAAAHYRRLELSLLGPLDAAGAGRQAARLTASVRATLATSPQASAVVVGGPSWEEIGLAPAAVAASDRSAEDVRAGLLDALAEVPGWKPATWRSQLKVRFILRTAAEATDLLARREDAKAAVLRLGGELRRTHLEMGRRLTARGALSAPIEVDLLSFAELHGAMQAGPAPPAAVLHQRRQWLRAQEDAGPLPARFHGAPDQVEVALPTGDRLEGWAASGGRFRGRTCVVRSPVAEVEPGVVLVAESTDPSWAPLFTQAGAIVLERGGPLSHAAILARELGLPAVTNVAGATRRLEGCEVEVDGDAGIVVVVSAGSPP